MVNSLNNYEMNLVTDPEILLTKNKIVQKVCKVFGSLSEDYKDIIKEGNVSIANQTEAKISKGENYKGLPYVMLDYPRQFSKINVFAIRSFFWWGNFFSVTLQLCGSFQQRYSGVIEKAIEKNLFEGWSVGVANDPWEHHFENDNYEAMLQGEKYNISNLPHLKMAKKIPLNKWDEVDTFFKKNFNFLITVLGS